MAYKTILVHLDTGKSRRQRLDLAFTLAERYDAHLVGLFGLQALDLPYDPEVAPMWLESRLDERRAAAAAAAREFHDKMAAGQYAGQSEWHEALIDGFAALQRHARHADLVIAGQPDGGGVPAAFSHNIVMSVGRPVLYVPHAGHFEDCGRKVFVSWNGSREAARAVEDALPFMQQAEVTDVVTFANDGAVPDADMEPYLARHHARANVALRPVNGDVGSAILSRAAEDGTDLLVMGAYSHSRLRELVLGGATRTVFKSMTVPTLMSH